MRSVTVSLRAILAVVLVGAVAAGAPGYAAAPGSVAGYALTATGQPLANAAVDIFEAAGGRPAGPALQTATTGAGGAFAFSRLAPGDYVVRLAAGRQLIGVPISLSGNGSIEGLRLVAPSMAAAGGAFQAQAGAAAAAAGAGAGAATTAVVVAAAVVGAAVVTSTVLVAQDAS